MRNHNYWRDKTRVVKKNLSLALLVISLTLLISLTVCEWLIFELATAICAFPSLPSMQSTQQDSERKGASSSSLRVMLLADIHLLGHVRGHWLDQIKREGQMRASFQAAIRNLSPDLIFMLGDVLDEGKYAYPHEFAQVTQRFNRYFTSFLNQEEPQEKTGKKVEVHVVTGNHDIGFHYDTNYYKVSRFEETFNTSKVKIVSRNGVHFLLLNSVLMRNDSCFLCDKTQEQLREAQKVLKCLSKATSDSPISARCSSLIRWHKLNHALKAESKSGYVKSKPIILQHFPLYRVSERHCFEADWTSDNLNLSKPLREDWDMLSEVVSRNLLSMFKPRLVLSGHSHYRCDIWHSYTKDANNDKTLEITINSFSWRNNDQPQILLLSVDQSNYVYSVCYLPRESLQIAIYLIIWCYNLVYLFRKCRDDQQSVSYLPFKEIYAFSKRFQVYRVSTIQKLR